MEEKKKEVVRLFYSCVLCEDIFNVERIIKAHMMYAHNKVFPAMGSAKERPSDDIYEFQVEGNFHEPFDVKRLGCPSCWSHFEIDDTQGYYTHAKQEHSLEDLPDNGNVGYALEIAKEGTQEKVQSDARDDTESGTMIAEEDIPAVTGEVEGFAEFNDKELYTHKDNIMAIVNAELWEICDFLKKRYYQAA